MMATQAVPIKVAADSLEDYVLPSVARITDTVRKALEEK
jgi:hypothetical protein